MMGIQSEGDAPNSHALSELEDFLVAAIKGDQVAFEMIWKNLNPRLTRYVAAKSYNTDLDYEEIVSETWISVAKDIGKFKGGAVQLRSWIYTIARNRLIDAVRKSARQVKRGGDITDIDIADARTNIQAEIEANEALVEIIAKINELPDAQSEAVMLRIVADLEISEVAELLGKSENAIRVLCHRGLETLRGQLGGATYAK